MSTTPVVVPELGNEIAEALVETIEKRPGDSVAQGDVLMTLTTPKVAIEIEAPHAGTIASVEVEVDDIVETGTTLVTVGAG